MTRVKRPLPDGHLWVGRRVAYRGEPGTVMQMATGKELCMFVQYDNSPQPKLTYARDLEKIDDL